VAVVFEIARDDVSDERLVVDDKDGGRLHRPFLQSRLPPRCYEFLNSPPRVFEIVSAPRFASS
jgi:hypothetical protein